ncbi:N-acetylmuramoyl-L-alanine amidase [Bradyrhizobium sp. Tv2a-2]|uniref:N-acetylmuramoyl-L-alanine amidase n=1 Tax=Bradyrhizobium sp. Tv2a-2 TaxID=113395 RepID=UPI0004172E58|nr:N-acetylmuramoyl-L-alanine amidase [Bradyrhizobium sp. Tv2a-2]
MQIGLITIDGRAIGIISLEHGTHERPNYVPPAPSLLHDASLMTEEGVGSAGPRHAPGYGSPSHGGDRYTSRQVDGAPSPVVGNRVYGRLADARDRAREELKAHPELNEKAMHIFAGENPDPDASTALWEETINRMAVRGTTLDKELRRTNEGGYYEGWRDEVSTATRKTLEASRDRALNYSNVSNYATDNSSGGLARRDRESGNFTEKQVYNGEHFFGPDNRIAAHQRAYNDLVNESESMARETGGRAVSAPSSTPTSSMTAPNGQAPQAFIFHHTGGGGGPEGVRDTLEGRHLGVEYIMDREGNIVPGGGNMRSHMLPGWGKGEGLSNNNTVGMEVIARDNKDVTPAQVAAARAFIAKNYPNTPVYGHGEVNPGHKEADEGAAIVNAIRSDRASQAAQAKPPETKPDDGKI